MNHKLSADNPARCYADLVERLSAQYEDAPDLDLRIARALVDEVRTRKQRSISVDAVLREISSARQPSAVHYDFSSRLAIAVREMADPKRVFWGDLFFDISGKVLLVPILLASIAAAAIGFETPMVNPSSAGASLFAVVIGVGGIFLACALLFGDFY